MSTDKQDLAFVILAVSDSDDYACAVADTKAEAEAWIAGMKEAVSIFEPKEEEFQEHMNRVWDRIMPSSNGHIMSPEHQAYKLAYAAEKSRLLEAWGIAPQYHSQVTRLTGQGLIALAVEKVSA